MTISHIKTFRVKDQVITQGINLENDAVYFSNAETNKIIFIMKSDCKTYFQNKDKVKIFMGKFSYTNVYGIRFVYDDEFANNYPVDAPINRTITFFKDGPDSLPITDFIKAEEIFVTALLNNYSSAFVN